MSTTESDYLTVAIWSGFFISLGYKMLYESVMSHINIEDAYLIRVNSLLPRPQTIQSGLYLHISQEFCVCFYIYT